MPFFTKSAVIGSSLTTLGCGGTQCTQNELTSTVKRATTKNNRKLESKKVEKSTKRRRPSFEKVLKCLIIYNEIKTGNRAKALAKKF